MITKKNKINDESAKVIVCCNVTGEEIQMVKESIYIWRQTTFYKQLCFKKKV